MAPQGLPRLLAMDVQTRPGPTADPRGDEDPHRSDGHGERLACRKIQAELSKLGIRVGLTTIARYPPKTEPGKDPQQRWMTFLGNHRDLVAAMDFFVVPTARSTLLYVWFGSRRTLPTKRGNPSLLQPRACPHVAGRLPRNTAASTSGLRAVRK
jgi:hypothetical protein